MEKEHLLHVTKSPELILEIRRVEPFPTNIPLVLELISIDYNIYGNICDINIY